MQFTIKKILLNQIIYDLLPFYDDLFLQPHIKPITNKKFLSDLRLHKTLVKKLIIKPLLKQAFVS